MENRRGEKAGWIGGWLGGFLWVLILSCVMIAQGKTPAGLAGLALSVIAVATIFRAAPWRYPSVPYWKLMTPLYLMLLLSAAWAIWSYGGPEKSGLDWWSLLWLPLLLLPIVNIGRRCWKDG
ncbi:MAG: hypothetical protein HGA78_02785 [Nitrospirales bacterium]|nr:hypothetical protein [Nitrospirales bacterium]